MMFKVLLSFAVCGVSALESDTPSRLHHHKHVEAHAHKANAAGIIGAAAVGAAGVGALGTMGSFSSDATGSTSDSSSLSDNICSIGFTDQALDCSLNSVAISQTTCTAATSGTTTCVWVERTGGANGLAIYEDAHLLAKLQCFADPNQYSALTSPKCSWWSNSKTLCGKATSTARATPGDVTNANRECIYDTGALACNQCRSKTAPCSDFMDSDSCASTAANAVRLALTTGPFECEWAPKTTGATTANSFECKKK